MIAPHQDKELDLMLTGKKPAAIFYDAVPESGIIPEEIIPRNAFAPHVRNKSLLMFEDHFFDGMHTIQRVVYTLPDQAWRAPALFWISNFRYNNQIIPNEADDILIGLLLGYETHDIQDFLEHIKQL